MDNELEFLFAGFAVFWAGLFVYLVLLQMRLRALQQEVETLEERLGEYEGTSDATPTSTAPMAATPEPGAGASSSADA